MLRLFYAFPLSDAVKAELLARQALLRHRREAVSWVTGACLHLTAVFLGEQPRERLGTLEDLLERVCEGQGPLEFRLGPSGVFGSPERPRILQVELDGPREDLGRLVRSLEQGLRGRGVTLEKRRYHPHITLGRVREGGSELAAAHLGTACLPLPVRLDRLELWESRLHPGGPEYRPLSGRRLEGSRTL